MKSSSRSFADKVAVVMFLIVLLVSPCHSVAQENQSEQSKPRETRILAHYMPWFSADLEQEKFGWHWTMNHFQPTQEDAMGRRNIASHFYPLIGPYDSGDRDVIEYHLLTMKTAGIDGVVIDWYGRAELYDYPAIHKNTLAFIEMLDRFEMQFVICYEDQTIPKLVKQKKLKSTEMVTHAISEIRWMQKHWFQKEKYVKLNGKPVLLSFGHSGLSDSQWREVINTVGDGVSWYSEHRQRPGAVGVYDWPQPKLGIGPTRKFSQQDNNVIAMIPVVYPRFQGIYQKANAGGGFGKIMDANGKTFDETLRLAIDSKSAIIQIATWNDWGEGTVIEPSQELLFRDLEKIQLARRENLDPRFKGSAADLELPMWLYQYRKSDSPGMKQEQLNRVSDLISEKEFEKARELLEGYN